MMNNNKYKPLDRSKLSQIPVFKAFEMDRQRVAKEVQQDKLVRQAARQEMFRKVEKFSTATGAVNNGVTLYNTFRQWIHPAAPSIPTIPDPKEWSKLGR